MTNKDGSLKYVLGTSDTYKDEFRIAYIESLDEGDRSFIDI
jgi:hypothetical protein